MFSTLFVLLFAASSVSAHGIIVSGSVVNQNGDVVSPFGLKDNSPIRMATDPSPNTDVRSPAITCGPGSKPAPGVLDVNAGDTISLKWGYENNVEAGWPHNTGPVIFYLANCGDVSCNKFDQKEARFFKILQLGRKPKKLSEWYQYDLWNKGGNQEAKVRIPDNIAKGNYLLRHEIIALHVAPPEFYPGCVQLRINGSGSGVPETSETTPFPGGYNENDPGIEIESKNVYNQNFPYQIPGPDIPKVFASGSGSDSSKPPATSKSKPNKSSTSSHHQPSGDVNANNNNPSSTSPPSPSDTPKVCNKKKGTPASGSNSLPPTLTPSPGSDPAPMPTTTSDYRRRRSLNRIMRRAESENGLH